MYLRPYNITIFTLKNGVKKAHKKMKWFYPKFGRASSQVHSFPSQSYLLLCGRLTMNFMEFKLQSPHSMEFFQELGGVPYMFILATYKVFVYSVDGKYFDYN